VRYRAVDVPHEALLFLSNIDSTLNWDVDLAAFYATIMQTSRYGR
jgi:hypothetical protein